MKFIVTLSFLTYTASVRVHAANIPDAVAVARHALGLDKRWQAQSVEMN